MVYRSIRNPTTLELGRTWEGALADTERALKIAVIGGGCAAITAAFELSRPVHRVRYDVTVYQIGWRLGGKGASGRGPSGRIEEHGLHLWLGFYDNAFRLLRECYDELGADPGSFAVSDWREAFCPESDIGLLAEAGPESWLSWSACFPPQDGLPGDDFDPSQPFSLQYYLGRAIELLRTLIFEVEVIKRGGRPGDTRVAEELANDGQRDERLPASNTDRITATIGALAAGGIFATAMSLAEALALLQGAIGLVGAAFPDLLTHFVEKIAADLRVWLENNLLADSRFRYIWEIVDLVLAIVVGTVRFGLLSDPRGLDAINQYECREWLLLNGASRRSVQSPFVRGLYDLALAYEAGDPSRPGLAAGQALRGSLRMFFGYRGALFWRMRAGMGDVVFAPFYEVLRRRGVKFRFFHKLTNIRLAPEHSLEPGERSYVTALEFDIQAKVKGGGEYAPLIMIGGRPCWPSVPDYSQLEGGDTLAEEARDFESQWEGRRAETRALEVGADFDFVVLGVSIGVVPYVCREILARDRRWRAMVEHVKTVATQSFQVWLNADLAELGWRGPPFIASAFLKPFDTWCDMAHVIPEEAWAKRPRTSVYFCGVLAESRGGPEGDGSAYAALRQEEVRRNAIAFLRRDIRHLWPKAFDSDGEFRWELLVDPAELAALMQNSPTGPARFVTQYWRANVNPSDRHALALPGSLQHRISPLDMTYDNMTIAGDWTDCGFNEGCVEAAVMSGRLAAHALTGAPALEEIIGFDHP
jgi:uncharacterized protein with NAD-binding domain and iron-sulfur cluster